jgi:hypothetical protein
MRFPSSLLQGEDGTGSLCCDTMQAEKSQETSVNAMLNYFATALLAAGLFVCGCEAQPKQTYHSPRRILALEFDAPNQSPRIIKYLTDPKDSDQFIYEGKLGAFQGIITGRVMSSSASTWQVQIQLDGTNAATSAVHMTNLVSVIYPQNQHTDFSGMVSVTAWFLSDEQLVDFDKNMSR